MTIIIMIIIMIIIVIIIIIIIIIIIMIIVIVIVLFHRWANQKQTSKKRSIKGSKNEPYYIIYTIG